MEIKTAAIIQARVGSTRLPGKVLMKVLGRPILEYVIERAKNAKSLEDVIIATTSNERDLDIVKLANRLHTTVYRGSENDVLDRYYQTARAYKIKHIVRITSDCPFIDPEIVDKVVRYYFESGADYCSSTLESTLPDGEDVEVFSFKALSDAWKNAKFASEREHVTPYISKHPEKFKLVSFKNNIDLSEKRWTLDHEVDFKFIKIILESLYPKNPSFSMEDILDFLAKNPHLEEINKGFIRNESYFKSLKKDRIVK